MYRFLRQVISRLPAGIVINESQQHPLTYSYLSHYYPSLLRHEARSLSSLYVSERTGKETGYFKTELDGGERLKDIDGLRKTLKRRGIDMDLDQLVMDHQRMVELEKERIRLEAERKRLAALIASLLKIKNEQLVSKEIEAQIAETKLEGKQVKEALKELMPEWWDLEECLQRAMLSLPNHLLTSVPDVEPSLIQEFFNDKKVVTDHNHMELIYNTGLVKFRDLHPTNKYCHTEIEHAGTNVRKAVEVLDQIHDPCIQRNNIGPRCYYLRGRLAELEQSLIQHVSTQLRNHGYMQMIGPDMFKTPVVETAGVDFNEASEVYRVAEKVTDKNIHIQDQMWLRGCSHMTFLAFLARNILQESQLPMKLFSVGRHYIPETAVDSSLPGLYGALQSIKLSGTCISRSVEDNMKQLREAQTMVSDIFRIFKLPYRLVNMPVNSLSPAEQNRIELQIWAPSLQQYLKMASVSSIGDYGSRRLIIRSSSRRGSPDTNLVQMVSIDVCDITRMIALLIEYGQWDQDIFKT